MSLVGCILSGKDVISSLAILKSRYSKISLVKKYFLY